MKELFKKLEKINYCKICNKKYYSLNGRDIHKKCEDYSNEEKDVKK